MMREMHGRVSRGIVSGVDSALGLERLQRLFQHFLLHFQQLSLFLLRRAAAKRVIGAVAGAVAVAAAAAAAAAGRGQQDRRGCSG